MEPARRSAGSQSLGGGRADDCASSRTSPRRCQGRSGGVPRRLAAHDGIGQGFRGLLGPAARPRVAANGPALAYCVRKDCHEKASSDPPAAALMAPRCHDRDQAGVADRLVPDRTRLRTRGPAGGLGRGYEAEPRAAARPLRRETDRGLTVTAGSVPAWRSVLGRPPQPGPRSATRCQYLLGVGGGGSGRPPWPPLRGRARPRYQGHCAGWSRRTRRDGGCGCVRARAP